MATAQRFRPLPAISQVDRADNYLGLFLSDLDSLTSQVQRYGSETDDSVFLALNGIATDESAEFVDPAIIARLLVFANELEEDAETIANCGRRLRASLLALYQERVVEPTGRRRNESHDA